MNAVNYDSVMQTMLKEAEGKRLLLHACCAPCASYCLTATAPFLSVTTFFYNPNMDTAEEYEKRLRELRRLTAETGWADVLETGYRCEDFMAVATGMEQEKEGGARCAVCCALRLEETAKRAAAAGADYFGTTLTVSPLKNAVSVNEAGRALALKYGVAYLVADLKKKDGYLDSVRTSRELGLYRQHYCGCEFSLNKTVEETE